MFLQITGSSIQSFVGQECTKMLDFVEEIFDNAPMVSFLLSEILSEPEANLFVNQLRELCSTLPDCIPTRSWLQFERIVLK